MKEKLTEKEMKEMREGVDSLLNNAKGLMIATNNGVGIVGDTATVLTLLSTIINHLIDDIELGEELIDSAVLIGKHIGKHGTDKDVLNEELHKQLDKLIESIKNKFDL